MRKSKDSHPIPIVRLHNCTAFTAIHSPDMPVKLIIWKYNEETKRSEIIAECDAFEMFSKDGKFIIQGIESEHSEHGN